MSPLRNLFALGCGALAMGGCAAQAAAPPKTVTVPRSSASSDAPRVNAPVSQETHRAIALALVFEHAIPKDTLAIALDRGTLYVNVGGKLQAFDARGPVAPSASTPWRPGEPLRVVGDDAFEPMSFAPHAPPLPKGAVCEGHAFSADGARASVTCRTTTGDDAVRVFDTRTGAELGVFDEFHSAAPVRAGAITESGNFIFWSARATGAFEEISSHVTGPHMSSHSVMSRDEHLLFTTADRTWLTQDRSPAHVDDPKNGKALFVLGTDVDTAFFSPSSKLLAVHHSARWADMEHPHELDKTWITIHEGDHELARIPGDDAIDAAFAPDDSAIAVRFASGVARVYAIHR